MSSLEVLVLEAAILHEGPGFKTLKRSKEFKDYFKEYFMLRSQSDNQHRCTRSSITDIIIPKFHLDVDKKSFYYHGALTFNSLPSNEH